MWKQQVKQNQASRPFNFLTVFAYFKTLNSELRKKFKNIIENFSYIFLAMEFNPFMACVLFCIEMIQVKQMLQFESVAEIAQLVEQALGKDFFKSPEVKSRLWRVFL